MQSTLIKFTTQTAAERARRSLTKYGLQSSLKRNPYPNHREGCSYALFINGSVDDALWILTNAGIRHNGIESIRDQS